jgi:chromosome partitioning protein
VGAEIELVERPERERVLALALEEIRGEYDYILVDCPPSLGLLTLNTLTAADSVLIPIQCEFYALEGLSQLLSTVRLVQRGLNPGLEI